MQDGHDASLELWTGFLQAHATLIAAMERELLTDQGLPLTWYEVLLRLAREPEGAMRMQDLARSVLLSKSGITRVVDRMEREGLVERRHCSVDRRGTYASLTKAGRAAFDAAMPVHLAGVRDHFSRHLSAEEAAVLHGVLGRIVSANARDAAPPCDPVAPAPSGAPAKDGAPRAVSPAGAV